MFRGTEIFTKAFDGKIVHEIMTIAVTCNFVTLRVNPLYECGCVLRDPTQDKKCRVGLICRQELKDDIHVMINAQLLGVPALPRDRPFEVLHLKPVFDVYAEKSCLVRRHKSRSPFALNTLTSSRVGKLLYVACPASFGK